MYAAQGIIAALFDRQRSGKGCRIDIALYDAGVMITSYYGLEALLSKKNPPSYGNAHPSVVPYGVFEAADGRLVVAIGNNEQFKSFCKDVIDRPDLAMDDRYGTNLGRMRHREILLKEVERELLKRKRSTLLPALAAAGIPSGEVLGLYEAMTNERTLAGGLIHYLDHPSNKKVPVMGSPWRFNGERLEGRRPPMLGEHSDEFDLPLQQSKTSD